MPNSSRRNSKQGLNGKQGLKRLKRNGGHPRTKSASLTCYLYQKEELVKRAHAQGMTISYYLNWLLWKDWVA